MRPSGFVFNEQTATSNAFQIKPSEAQEIISQKVQREFEQFVHTLKSNGINALVFDDTPEPIKPDAIFPNNWVTFHEDGTVILYPMCTPNRQHERRLDIIETLKQQFSVNAVLDLSAYEKEGKFLEGTGSIVFDHVNKMAYACLSPRTDKWLFEKVCAHLGYQAISFFAHDQNGTEIYHTNVMMCIGNGFAVVCLESISDKTERDNLLQQLSNTQHQIVDIGFEQMNQFSGNMLEVKTTKNTSLLVMSQSTFNALSKKQKEQLQRYCELLPMSIPTIETIGGGSARCMMAEVFLEKN